MRINYKDSFTINVEDDGYIYGRTARDIDVLVTWYETKHQYTKRIQINPRWNGGGGQNYIWKSSDKNSIRCDFHIFRQLRTRYDKETAVAILKCSKIFDYKNF